MDYTGPFQLTETLLDKFDGTDILPDLRIYGVYTGNVFEPAHNFGAFGFLPIAGTASGDAIGWTPLPGQPPELWPVLKFSHNGGETCVVSSSLPLLAASSIVGHIRPGYILEDREEILENKNELLALAKLLGDETRANGIIQFLESLKEDDESDYPGSVLYTRAEGPTWLVEFLETYKKVYVEDENAIIAWNAFLKNHPFVIPAHELLFLAQLKNGADASGAAWHAVTSEIYLSNFIFRLCDANSPDFDFDTSDSENYDLLAQENARLEACRYLVESNRFAGQPQMIAIRLEADEADCSEAWFDAGQDLLKTGQFYESYKSFINAAGHHYQANAEFWKDAAVGALAAARGIQDPVMIELIEPLTEDEPEE